MHLTSQNTVKVTASFTNTSVKAPNNSIWADWARDGRDGTLERFGSPERAFRRFGERAKLAGGLVNVEVVAALLRRYFERSYNFTVMKCVMKRGQ